MNSYDDYIDMIRKSIWNLYYVGFIDEKDFIRLKDKFYNLHGEMMAKKDSYIKYVK